jgi:hypothetical protein
VQEVAAEGDEGGADAPRSRVPLSPRDVEYMRVRRGRATRQGDLRVVLVAARQSKLRRYRHLARNPSGERVRRKEGSMDWGGPNGQRDRTPNCFALHGQLQLNEVGTRDLKRGQNRDQRDKPGRWFRPIGRALQSCMAEDQAEVRLLPLARGRSTLGLQRPLSVSRYSITAISRASTGKQLDAA